MSWLRQVKRIAWYIRVKCYLKHILLPLIIFQFCRTLIFPTTFDVILLGCFALAYVALTLDWI